MPSGAMGNLGLKSISCKLFAAVGGVLLLTALPASAQDLGPLPLNVLPIMAPTPKAFKPLPLPQVADTHVESTELGFEKGVGPAIGRTVTFRSKVYEVTDVTAIGGGPTFSGGSKFTVAPSGGSLRVGLKAVDPETVATLARMRDPASS